MIRRELGRLMLGLSLASVVFLAGSSASATPLGVVLEPEPDIFIDFASVNYVAATDTLTITGFASNVDNFGVVNQAITGGTFDLTATVNDLGVLSAGSLTVGGTVATAPFNWNSGTILTGNLTAIGFPDGVAGALEFLFTATGGDAQSEYGGTGAVTIGIVNGFGGDWTNDFSASFSATGDVGTLVPEPSTGLLLSMGLGIMGVKRRKRT